MYDRILVPLDGSPEAEEALPHARSLASRFRSELILVRVDVPIPNLPESRYPPQIESTASTYLKRVAEPMILKQLRVRPVVVFGDPAHEILSCVDRLRVDLIVLVAGDRVGGWRGRGVVAQLSRRSHVPLLLVRGHPPDRAAAHLDPGS
ncbi:MAG: universal stress protein [Actinomycetota bacterium]